MFLNEIIVCKLKVPIFASNHKLQLKQYIWVIWPFKNLAGINMLVNAEKTSQHVSHCIGIDFMHVSYKINTQ